MRTEPVCDGPDAIPDYGWMAELPRTAWAWEWLRRSTDYREAFAAHGAAVPHNLADPEAARWGLLRFEDPARDARQAQVLWRHQDCREILPLAVSPDLSSTPPTDFPGEMACRVTLVENPVRDERDILFSEAGRSLQLHIRGAGRLGDGALVTPVFPVPSPRAARLMAIRRFADVMAQRRLRPALYPREPRRDRLLRVVQALDGHLAGLPQREIAIGLFGPEKVAEHWHGSANMLRDYVRRAIGYGRELANGGYVRFLR